MGCLLTAMGKVMGKVIPLEGRVLGTAMAYSRSSIEFCTYTVLSV
jgi:hypothetical protein